MAKIPYILLLQIVIDLEQKKREGKIKEYIDGVIELIALYSGKSVDEVKNMKDEEFLYIYTSLKKEIEDKDSMSKVLKFFQES